MTKVNTYRTIQGDTWDGIAYKLYGSEKHMVWLLEANLGCTEVVIFSAGIELVVPDAAPDKVSSLPPWKRGPLS